MKEKHRTKLLRSNLRTSPNLSTISMSILFGNKPKPFNYFYFYSIWEQTQNFLLFLFPFYLGTKANVYIISISILFGNKPKPFYYFYFYSIWEQKQTFQLFIFIFYLGTNPNLLLFLFLIYLRTNPNLYIISILFGNKPKNLYYLYFYSI